jgi:hypothetical protein
MLYALSLPADKVPAGSDWVHEIKYDGFCNEPVCVNPSFHAAISRIALQIICETVAVCLGVVVNSGGPAITLASARSPMRKRCALPALAVSARVGVVHCAIPCAPSHSRNSRFQQASTSSRTACKAPTSAYSMPHMEDINTNHISSPCTETRVTKAHIYPPLRRLNKQQIARTVPEIISASLTGLLRKKKIQGSSPALESPHATHALAETFLLLAPCRRRHWAVLVARVMSAFTAAPWLSYRWPGP